MFVRQRAIHRSQSGPCQQPRVPPPFAGGERIEVGERRRQLAGRRAERPRRRSDFAEHDDGEQAARFQASNDRFVQAAVPELMAQDDVDGRTRRQTAIQVGDVEAAKIADAAAPRQIPRLTHGDRRDIHSPHLEPSSSEPDGGLSLPAREVESPSLGGKQVRVARQDVRRPNRAHRRRPLGRVPLIPATPFDLGHRRHLKADPGLTKPPALYTGLVSETSASPVGPADVGAARRSDRRPGQTIRKVLDAGLEELRESSYAKLTMRAVATRAGVSPASAYTYFPSKSALVAAVYLRFLRDLPLHTDVNDNTKARVSATMRDMAVVVADEPELTAACGAALMADDPAVQPLRGQIGEEVSRRIGAALGPGWPRAVKSTLQMTFAGALMTARFVSFPEIAGQLDEAVNLILGASTS